MIQAVVCDALAGRIFPFPLRTLLILAESSLCAVSVRHDSAFVDGNRGAKIWSCITNNCEIVIRSDE